MVETQVVPVEEGFSGDERGNPLIDNTPHATTRSRRRRRTRGIILNVLLVLAFLLVSAAAVFVVLFALEKQKEGLPAVKTHVPTTPGVCTTRECVLTISELLHSVDPTVNPCVDFYSYACGGWVKKNPVPKRRYTWDHWDILGQEVEAFITKSLKSTDVKSKYSKVASVIKAFDFVDSCMSAALSTDSVKNLLELINKFVDWPPLNPKSNESSFDLVATLAALNKELSIDPFFITVVETDLKNTSQNMVTLYHTVFGGLWQIHNHLIKNTPFAKRAVKGYKQTIANLTKLLGVHDKAKREKLAEEIVELELAANKLAINWNRYQREEPYGKYSINEMNNITGSSSIDWLRYVNLLYKDLGKTFTGDDHIIVNDVQYFIKIAEFLRGIPKRTLMTYTGWVIILKYYPFMDQTFQDIYNKFQEQALDITPSPRELLCYFQFRSTFEMPLSRVYVDAKFKGGSKHLAEEMMSFIRKALIESLEESTWMDKQSRSEAVLKAKYAINEIGYPDYIIDDEKLDKEFEEIIVYKESYFKTLLTIDAYSKKNEFLLVLKPVDRKSWNQSPLLVNTVYRKDENKMSFPAAFLQPPFYDTKYSKAVSFGGAGTIMGHELVHGFDDEGKDFDKNGNNVKWLSDATLATFNQRMQCLVKQYNNITFMGEKVNGEKSLSENICDNGGVRQTFKAYQMWKKINGEEPRLPGTMLSNDQVFFLSFARNWCKTYKIRDPFKQEEYSPNPVRVNTSLKNLPEFSKAFHCPLGSPMNPRRKCPTWLHSVVFVQPRLALGKKIDKIKRITMHYYEMAKGSTFPSTICVSEDSGSDESDSDNDLVLYESEESDSESDIEEYPTRETPECTTRSGRRVGHWSTRYSDFIP